MKSKQLNTICDHDVSPFCILQRG